MKLSVAGGCGSGFKVPCFLVVCITGNSHFGNSVLFGVVRSLQTV